MRYGIFFLQESPFSFARLGNVHAMSHPVSAFFNVAHGVANAVLLPVIAEYMRWQIMADI